MVMRTAAAADRSDICQTAPCTLFPSPFPYSLFQEAMDIQQVYYYFLYKLKMYHGKFLGIHTIQFRFF